MRKAGNTDPATTRRHLPSAMRYLGACAHDEPLDVTLVFRRRQPMERPMPRVQRSEFAARYGADPADVERVRAACPHAKILLGSGVNLQNVKDFLRIADGVIVGSSLKRDGKLANPVDARRVAALVKALEKL